jgi:hypothetical protein
MARRLSVSLTDGVKANIGDWDSKRDLAQAMKVAARQSIQER